MDNFDPSKAEIGFWNRKPWNGNVKRPEELNSRPTWEMDPEDYEFEKEADDTTFTPADTAMPSFPDPVPGEVENTSSRTDDVDTDLNTHGVHEAKDPKRSDILRAKIRNMRAQVINKEKKVLQEAVKQQDAEYKARQESPTEIDINRREIETGWPSFRKSSESVLVELSNDDINPIRLMLILDTQWGPEWKEWEPETIIQTARQDGTDIERINLDKIMAIKVLVNTDDFWEDPRVFEKVCLAFSGRMVDWGQIQEPRIHEIASTVALVERYIKELAFTDDVATYVAAAAVRDGFILLPPVLSFASGEFSLELAMNIGDDVLKMQKELRRALDEEDESILSTTDAVQYMRLMRCQYHVQDMIDSARA